VSVSHRIRLRIMLDPVVFVAEPTIIASSSPENLPLHAPPTKIRSHIRNHINALLASRLAYA